MLADGLRCHSERWCIRHERRIWKGRRGFLSRIAGGGHDDLDVQPHSVHLVDVQEVSGWHDLASASAHLARAGLGHLGERPAHVDLGHWILELVLRQVRRYHAAARMLQHRVHLPALAQHSPRGEDVCRSWWQCLLGRELLHGKDLVDLPDCRLGLGRADLLHLGRLRAHVRGRAAGHTLAQKVGAQMADHPLRPRRLAGTGGGGALSA
mmetsp:Transcript_103255/g.296387  ORF Transcript_103255/g.296387 Transcript_103255/m.296387 type:complete len:209 (+) Transcript_103255:210-836(+)